VAGFEGYRCWTIDDAVALPTEAVVASRAFFFATHAPLKIYRAEPDGRRTASAEPVNEEAVWRDFLRRKTSGGVLLMPVIGESGTGKSHLVRWVREKTPSTEKREVIYLPKSDTSLKAVVKALLAGVKNAALDQLRDDVDRMSSGLDQSGLEQRLVNQLQEALVAAPMETGPARVLSGMKGLAVLLLDPHVRDHLLRPEALIPRMAKSILTDRGRDEKDRPLEFTTDDLPLDILDVKRAAADTQKMLQLLGPRPELQATAVRMLNDQLQRAVAEATAIGAGRLQQAMLEVRREYARQGKEIILLIEDFAVIQGFQGDLLDAVIEVGERDGRGELAPIRTLMAVTSGYYGKLPDTVRTRVRAETGFVYSLDVQFRPAAGMSETSSFVGRYLNAARLGQEKVGKYEARENAGVPNACDDCDFRERCRDAFGQTAEGYGLYPFNESSLRRAIRARPAPGSVGAFNPRVVIGEVVRKVLVEHAGAIAEGRFPDEQFAAEYRARRDGETGYSAQTREKVLSAAARSVLHEFDPEDEARHATFLEFWGDAPDAVVNLDPVMHEAFEIRRLDVEELELGRSPEPDIDTGSGRVPPPPLPDDSMPASLKRAIDHVEDWATREARLNQGTASDIRQIIRDAVVQRCLWNNPLMPEPTSELLRAAWPVGSAVVSIDGAFGEREAAAGAAPIRFRRSSPNAVFFQGLLRRAKAGDVQGSAEAWRRLAGYADRYQGQLQQAVLRRLAATDEQLAIGVRASLIGAALAGKALPDMNEAELLAVVLEDGNTWIRADAESCAGLWQATLKKHLATRPELVEGLRSGLGISRGSRGGVRMIDAARALPMLREAFRTWRWATPGMELPPWVRKAVGGFAEWDGLLNAQISALAGQLSAVRALLPADTSLSDTIEAVRKAVDAAREAGAEVTAPQLYTQLQSLLSQAAEQDRESVKRLERDLSKAAEDQEPGPRNKARILAAARDRGPDIAVIREFLVASHSWLTTALSTARMRHGGAQHEAETQVRELQSRWASVSGES
jgi:hypothetical protein